jgi:hypothetical protein
MKMSSVLLSYFQEKFRALGKVIMVAFIKSKSAVLAPKDPNHS